MRIYIRDFILVLGVLAVVPVARYDSQLAYSAPMPSLAFVVV